MVSPGMGDPFGEGGSTAARPVKSSCWISYSGVLINKNNVAKNRMIHCKA